MKVNHDITREGKKGKEKNETEGNPPFRSSRKRGFSSCTLPREGTTSVSGAEPYGGMSVLNAFSFSLPFSFHLLVRSILYFEFRNAVHSILHTLHITSMYSSALLILRPLPSGYATSSLRSTLCQGWQRLVLPRMMHRFLGTSLFAT